MTQILLFPDPRPLVERLGRDFFRRLPEGAGVYLMRNASEKVIYVGKAKCLRKRLASYRVANPDRMARRHLRLLRAVQRIELRECPDEAAALAMEAALIRELKPRFNRAGTWKGPDRFLAWRASEAGLELAVVPAVEAGWCCWGPMGTGAYSLRRLLVRLLWCALYPDRGLAGMPQGWFQGRSREPVLLPAQSLLLAELERAARYLESLMKGRPEELIQWVRLRTESQTHAFERAVLEANLEEVAEWGQIIAEQIASDS